LLLARQAVPEDHAALCAELEGKSHLPRHVQTSAGTPCEHFWAHPCKALAVNLSMQSFTASSVLRVAWEALLSAALQVAPGLHEVAAGCILLSWYTAAMLPAVLLSKPMSSPFYDHPCGTRSLSSVGSVACMTSPKVNSTSHMQVAVLKPPFSQTCFWRE
jgi:hypothetical protein